LNYSLNYSLWAKCWPKLPSKLPIRTCLSKLPLQPHSRVEPASLAHLTGPGLAAQGAATYALKPLRMKWPTK
jgi:hypothetical protein